MEKQSAGLKTSGSIMFWAAVVCVCAAYFILSSGRALWDPGEGRYAAIAREMASGGSWLVPHLNFVRYFEKPPLAYWLNAFSFKVFGYNEFAARFFTVLSGLLMLAGTYLFSLRIFGRQAAVAGAAILCSAAGFFAYCQIPELDMLFSFFLCSGLWLFYMGFEKQGNPSLCLHVAYAMLGLGCLVKGPASFVLAFLVAAAYVTATGQWRRWRDMKMLTGIPLALLVSAPWFVAMSATEKDFFSFFFVREHFQRFTSTTHSRKGSFWYFIPVIAAAMYPWTVSLCVAAKRLVPVFKKDSPIFRPVLYLALWAAVIFVFFSISGSKRPPYMVPVFPPLALLAGLALSANLYKEGDSIKIAVGTALLNFFVVLGLAVAPRYIKYLTPETSLKTGVPMSLLALGTVLLLYYGIKRRDIVRTHAVLLFSGLVFLISAYGAATGLDPMLSRKAMSAAIMKNFSQGDVIVGNYADYDRNLQSMGFYTGQRIMLIEPNPGELTFGRDHAPDRDEYFITYEKLAEMLKTDRRIFVVLKKDDFPLFAVRAPVRIYQAEEFPGKLALCSNRPWR